MARLSIGRGVVLVAALPLLGGSDCHGPGDGPNCYPCPDPVTVLVSAEAPIHDVAITATFTRQAHLGFACDETVTPIECTVYPVDMLGSAFDGTYSLTISAPGFVTQTTDVVVPRTPAPDDDPCSCHFVDQTIAVTLDSLPPP